MMPSRASTLVTKKPAQSKAPGRPLSADAAEQANWSKNAAERNVFPSAMGWGNAVAAQNRLLQNESRQNAINTWNANAAAAAGGGGGGGGSSRYSYGSGGGGGRGGGGRGGGGGGGGSAVDPNAMAAYKYMLNQFNWDAHGKPFNAQLIGGVASRDAAKADVGRIDAELKKRLAALGPNPYANMQPMAQVGSAQGSAGALQNFLAAQGVGGNELQSQVAMRGQMEGQDAERMKAMYSMLNAGGQAEQQSRMSQAAFANAGAQREIGDQWTQFTTALSMQRLQAEEAARQRLIEFALQAGIKPEGMTR